MMSRWSACTTASSPTIWRPRSRTVRLPVEEMAGRAVDLLVDLIDGGDELGVLVRTPPVLIARESTARPRKVKRLTIAERSA